MQNVKKLSPVAHLDGDTMRRKHSIIVVGAGLAGAAAAATLGQQGYHVQCFSYHDTPRQAHSIAAQGGINAAKNYRNDGDSISRLFKDTVKGGDFRAREASSCTNHGECEAVCTKEIPLEFIGKMNRDLIGATWHRRREPLVIPGIVQEPSHEHAGIEAESS
jgi:FAD binding domain